MNGWADDATITFANQTSGTNDGNNAYTTNNFVSSGIASSDAAFGTITCSATSKCYSGKTGYGMKAGASSNAGSFTIAFSTPLTNVSKITLNRASYNTTNSTTITVKNGTTTLGSASTPSGSTTFADMEISNLSIASLSGLTVQTGKYCYIKSITVTYTPSGGGNTDPSIGLSTTTINVAKAAVNTTTINVTYNNLTEPMADVIFYKADGTTPTAADTYPWLNAEIRSTDVTKLDYLINENSGFERKAYFKVYAVADEGEVESSLITVTQKGAKYKVYIQEPTGGTLEVKNGETLISDGEGVNDGATLTITPTAADGYRYRNWQAVDASTHTYTTGTSYTIDAHDVTIKANFDEEYSVNWSVNGNVSTEKYVKDETIVFPNRPADLLGKKFVGWTATEIDGTQAEAPTLLAYGTKMGTSNVTYYAVFADASGESSTATLTSSEISSNITNSTTTMSYGTERSYSDTSDGITWVACGYTEAQNSKWVQIKKANNAYFKISSTKNIEEVRITITSASNSSGGAQDISKHTAFSGTVCLESEAKSTPTGALASSNVVSNNTVTVSLPVSLKQFYIQETPNSARVWGIELTTNNYTYSNYRTTVPAVVTVTNLETASGGKYTGNNYATMYYSEYALAVPTGVVAKTYKMVNGALTESRTYENGGTYPVIPAGEAVVIESDGAADYAFEVASTETTPDAESALAGTDAATTVDAAGYKYYKLALNNSLDKVGFFFAVAGGTSINNGAHKAYLRVATGGGEAKSFYLFEDTTTGIANVDVNANDNFDANTPMYNLAGQRVNKSYKGVVIVNGKKMFNK